METFRQIDADKLKVVLQNPSEFALLDVGEEGEYGLGHLLLAVNVPYSRLELMIGPLVPHKTCPLILMDHGNGVALKAAARLRAAQYQDISIFTGGPQGWATAGGELFCGIYVPSKAFGEWVEHEFQTPSIQAEDLARLFEANADVCVLDPRTVQEHAASHVPNAVSCPGGELIYRYGDLISSPETLVVVACGGRTRGIVGAQSLINSGVPNRVVALADGNHGWKLSGRKLEQGMRRRYGPLSGPSRLAAQERARGLMQRYAIEPISIATLQAWELDARRTTYVLDVRTPEEYAAGHYPGARNAPGGQLVQATDQWLAVRGARVVLVDNDGVRAAAAAHWLKHMGWEVHILSDANLDREPGTGESVAVADAAVDADEATRVPLNLAGKVEGAPEVEPEQAAQAINAGAMAVSLDRSTEFLRAHPPTAVWANRARLETLADAIRAGKDFVLFSDDGRLAHLAALDLTEAAAEFASSSCVVVAKGGQRAWAAAGLPLVSSEANGLPATDRVDVLYWANDRRHGNVQDMLTYLNWEKNLLGQLDADGFRFLRPAADRPAHSGYDS